MVVDEMNGHDSTDEFLAVLGHDMRSSLAVLSCGLEVWCRENPDVLGEVRQLMDRQVQCLIRMSNDLIDAAHILRGKLEICLECVSLEEIIREASREVEPILIRSAHVLSISVPRGPVLVFGDSSRLVQVFADLLQSSVKHTEKSGCIDISVQLDTGNAVIQVSNNDFGIERNALAPLFNSDQRTHESKVRATGRPGLGLNLIKGIVEAHGGSVAVAREAFGRGSTVTVVLPLCNKAVPDDHGHPLRSFAGSQSLADIPPPAYRIVVVDDDHELGDLLAKLLRMIGQSVTVADSGAETIDMILQRRPDVVFLSLGVDESHGYEVACQLRKRAELESVVLIALSGFGDERHRRRARDAGCDMFVVKPVPASVLSNLLSEVSAHRDSGTRISRG